MPTAAKNQPPPAEPPAEAAPTGLEDLSRRVAALEHQVGGMLTGQVAEISQEERDRQTLSRRPNSYHEAVEYEAAQKRQEERDRKAAQNSDDKAEPQDGA